ncbi:hypothetical protein FRC06_005169 [Ceratobasidium sp. 370]|nr:hypothetical protein FRC06_005169 [Ceratobasidium sp. 370]
MAGVGVPDNGEDGTDDDDDWETELELDYGETPQQRRSGVHYASYSPDSSSEWKPFPSKAKSLKSRVGDPSKQYVSPFDTVYYVNKISEGLKQWKTPQ